MPIRKFSPTGATFQRSPGQDGEIFAANMIDERHGSPVTIGFGRYGANETLIEKIAVDDTMVVLEGRLTVSTDDIVVTAGQSDIVNMPKGETVTIRAHGQGTMTAYVTYPHWKEAQA